MKALRYGRRAVARRSVKKRRTKSTIWWLRFSIASFLAFFVLSVVFHPTSYVLDYFRTYARIPSVFGVVNAQVASLFALAAFIVWVIGWGFLWYGRGELSRRHAKIVKVISWAVPLAIVYVWISSIAIAGTSMTHAEAVVFAPPLLFGCVGPILFVWWLQNSNERILSLFALFIGLFTACLWIATSFMLRALNPFTEVLLPIYFGFLSTTYLLTLLRITRR